MTLTRSSTGSRPRAAPWWCSSRPARRPDRRNDRRDVRLGPRARHGRQRQRGRLSSAQHDPQIEALLLRPRSDPHPRDEGERRPRPLHQHGCAPPHRARDASRHDVHDRHRRQRGVLLVLPLLDEQPRVLADFAPGRPRDRHRRQPQGRTDRPFLVFGTSRRDATGDRLLRLRGRGRGRPRRLQDPRCARASWSSRSATATLSAGKLPGGSIEVPFESACWRTRPTACASTAARAQGRPAGLRLALRRVHGAVPRARAQVAAEPPRWRSAAASRSSSGRSRRRSTGSAWRSTSRRSAAAPIDIGDLVNFAPPKGIGLTLDLAGAVKGGGYLFIDASSGEYAGALELKFLTFVDQGDRADVDEAARRQRGLVAPASSSSASSTSTSRSGSSGPALGGMLGLHHRSDLDALTAGMSTGALDDVLFPENPVADAPRIINRYQHALPGRARATC